MVPPAFGSKRKAANYDSGRKTAPRADTHKISPDKFGFLKYKNLMLGMWLHFNLSEQEKARSYIIMLSILAVVERLAEHG